MGKTKVFFRADGNSQMGIGHVIRSCAVAQMIREDFELHFFIKAPIEALKAEILQSDCVLHEIPAGDDPADEKWINALKGDEIIVLDGYAFSTAYQQRIKSKSCTLVCIDDIHSYEFVADVIINHAGGITAADYQGDYYTQYCLGLNYALLRPPFLATAREARPPMKNANLLICMGGADPGNHTLQVLNTCLSQPGIQTIFVVIGGAYMFKEQLEEVVAAGKKEVIIKTNISPGELCGVMKNCSIAVTTPSAIAMEYLSVGGKLFLQQIADNQKDVLNYYISNKIAFPFEDFNLHYERPAKKIIDGKSGQRIAQVFRNLEHRSQLAIVSASADDLEFYYQLAIDPETRKNSFNTEPIKFDDHVNWFNNKIKHPATFMFLLKNQEKNDIIGQIRFGLNGETAEIDYTVAPSHRGKGYGSILLLEGIRKLKTIRPVSKITGKVKKENIASWKAFETAGFTREADAESDYFSYIKK